MSRPSMPRIVVGIGAGAPVGLVAVRELAN
jgi:hypothetical protein